jgi:hypothetical protein
MCDGLTEIDTTTVKIHAADVAKQLNHEYQSQGGSKHMMAVLAGAFGQVMSDRLNQLSPEQRNQVFAVRQQLATPGRQLLECIFAGVLAGWLRKKASVGIRSRSDIRHLGRLTGT